MKKVDYEIMQYSVEYRILDSCQWRTIHYNTEEKAINFIKENRSKWSDYRMIKTQYAIIDF